MGAFTFVAPFVKFCCICHRYFYDWYPIACFTFYDKFTMSIAMRTFQDSKIVLNKGCISLQTEALFAILFDSGLKCSSYHINLKIAMGIFVYL